MCQTAHLLTTTILAEKVSQALYIDRRSTLPAHLVLNHYNKYTIITPSSRAWLLLVKSCWSCICKSIKQHRHSAGAHTLSLATHLDSDWRQQQAEATFSAHPGFSNISTTDVFGSTWFERGYEYVGESWGRHNPRATTHFHQPIHSPCLIQPLLYANAQTGLRNSTKTSFSATAVSCLQLTTDTWGKEGLPWGMAQVKPTEHILEVLAWHKLARFSAQTHQLPATSALFSGQSWHSDLPQVVRCSTARIIVLTCSYYIHYYQQANTKLI